MIFIPYNTPSSKNSRIFNNKLKRSFPSKTVQKYLKLTKKHYEDNKEVFLKLVERKQPPYRVEFTFIRDTKRKFDLINAAQIVQDLMVKFEWIEDDNYTMLVPSFGDTTVDKENAGVEIKVL